MTKKELCARAGAILRSGNVSSDDDAFLRKLIARHPQTAAKVGAGIDHFEIRQGAPFRQNVFWLVRVDGTETDFSYRRCVNNGKISHRARVLAAMRLAIGDQIVEFRQRALVENPVCALTGAPLTREALHVDHDPPFSSIAAEFFALLGGAEAIKLADEADGVIGRRFADTKVLAAWCEFHRTHAKLFLTSAIANMRKGAKRD
jgi:uncharacterized protein DUF3223